jgi:hypothetical protein
MSKSGQKTLKEILSRKPDQQRKPTKTTMKKLVDLAKGAPKSKNRRSKAPTKKPGDNFVRDLLKLGSNKRASIVAHFRSDDTVARGIAKYLIESGKTVEFDNRYSARKDRAHVPGQSDHVHVMLRGKDLAIINLDGTPSHNTDINQIPKHLRPRLRGMGVVIGEAYLIVEAADLAAVIAILRANIASIESR